MSLSLQLCVFDTKKRRQGLKVRYSPGTYLVSSYESTEIVIEENFR